METFVLVIAEDHHGIGLEIIQRRADPIERRELFLLVAGGKLGAFVIAPFRLHARWPFRRTIE